MPKPRKASLETPTARRRLLVRKKPYWTTISPGIGLGYRRNAGPGTWSVRGTDGHGADWIKRLGLADDFEPADDGAVLSYWQALDAARKAARGDSGEDGARPLTVDEAITRYKADLIARGGVAYNADLVRAHLSPGMLARLVSALTANELRKWRDSLLAKGLTASTVNRTRTPLKAALNLAASLDPERITNSSAWRIGLAALPGANRARGDVVLTDTEILRLIESARAIDARLGLYLETLAVTGARASQVARLTVGDLQADRLMMPTSRKGRGVKVIRHTPVPIPPGLAAALADARGNRARGAPLLLHPDGEAWGHSGTTYRQLEIVREAITCSGLDPDKVTPYALRHSSIIRMLRRNVPIRLVASLHDTSVAIIEKNYAAYIAHHADDIARSALLDTAAPAAANVVTLPKGRRP
jgi:integrase